MSDKQVRGQYTQEFKLEAVRQVKAGRGGNGQGIGHPQSQPEQLGEPKRQGSNQWHG